MSQRITPLTRNQLLELEGLVRNFIAFVTQSPQRAGSAPGSAGDESWPSSAPSTPTSLPNVAGGGRSAPQPPSTHSGHTTRLTKEEGNDESEEASAFAAGLSTSSAVASTAGDVSALSLPRGADHPVLHGTFIDVFADPYTASTWRLYDRILYVVWWSYRPPSCTNCGMQDAWMPSGDVEYKCAVCIAGAGTTRSNAVVEDDAAVTGEGDNDVDSGDEDDVDEKEKGSGGGGGGGGGGSGGGPIDTYLFFYEWLQRIPVLGPNGPSSSNTGSGNHTNATNAYNTNGGDGGGGVENTKESGRSGMRTFSSNPQLTRSGGDRLAGAATTKKQNGGGGGGAGQALTPHDSSSVMLPSGEALPTVLRAAYDISCLLTAPGLPRGTAPVIRAAGLYVSLLLHRYVSLFPLFCLAGRAVADGNRGIGSSAAAAAADADLKVATATASSPPLKKDAEAQQRLDVDLQWVDVELVSSLLGVAAPSFFESTEVSVQHLQNVFTVAAAYGVPSVLWHPGRVPGRVEMMRTFKDKVIALCPLHSTSAGVSGLSPEHTAMVVALELARRVDAHPVAASSTSAAAAAQNAQRIGMWLDALGLYPTRRVYRDANSFHQAYMAEEAEKRRAGAKTEKDGSRMDGGTVKKESRENAEAEEDEAEQRHAVLRAWEKSLTELAAVKDAHLISAAERHAHRHDPQPSLLDPSSASTTSSTLTTPRSPFHRRFEWILTSPCANALLHVFAAVFRLTPMELADMALRSGIYQGHASGFVTTLRSAMLRGAYDVMPLTRRLSPVTSSWMSAYMALHSGDRLPLLAALYQFNDGQNATRDRQAALTRLLQKILRKHNAAQLYQFNYMLRVTDDDEKHFNGIYFLSNVLWQEGLAVFTCLRSGRKTITLNRFAHTLSLNYLNAKEKIVPRLSMHVVSPVVAAVETDAARSVMEVALGTVARGVTAQGDPWGTVVRCLDKCARVRRRMRVPMLASRLDALASIRENVSTVVRRFQQFPSLFGAAGASGFAGGGAMMGVNPTLLGWGETETLLSAAPALDVRQLRRDLQWNLLALPNASLLSGLSENRVVAMYASLVGILELIHDRLSGPAAAATAAPSHNWVEELLFMEDEEEEEVGDVTNDFEASTAFPECGSGGGPGWSPPMYRNSRGGTPKMSRSPKSKFITVATTTTTTTHAPATSAFTTTYTGGSRYGAAPPPPPLPPAPFARQPYTMTPPSIAPSRSPMPRAVAGSTTPPLSCVRGGPAGSGGAAAAAGAASGSSFFVSHNAVSTPINRFRTPPSASASSAFAHASSTSMTPPLSMTSAVGTHNSLSSTNNAGTGGGGKRGSGRNATGSGMDGAWGDDGGDLLPDLELSASTADLEKSMSAGPNARQRLNRRRPRERSDSEDEHDSPVINSNKKNASWATDCASRDHGSAAERRSQQEREREAAREEEQQEKVLRLLTRTLPPYWEVLLGGTTDLALPVTGAAPGNTALTSPSLRGGRRKDALGDDDDEEDDDVEETGKTRGDGDRGSRRRAAGAPPSRERRPRRHTHLPQPSTSGAATALRSEVAVAHRPFNLFDAEECRRRLHRLYTFVGVYIARKQQCQQQAAEGSLPALPESKPSPVTMVTDSPQTPLRTDAAAGKRAGGSPRAPHSHLTPPPPYAALQRSPPHRSSPPVPSPRHAAPQLATPPHSPEPRSLAQHGSHPGSGRRGTPSLSPPQARPPHGSGGTSPVPQSPQVLPGRETVGGSPKRSPHTAPPRQSSPLSTPPLEGKRESRTGRVASGGAPAQRAVERTAVALVDDADFALPPSEVAWTQKEAERRSGDAKKMEKSAGPSSSTFAVAEQRETRRSRQQQKQLQQQQQQGKLAMKKTAGPGASSSAAGGASSSSSSASSTSSDTEEEESLDVAVAIAQPTRKRAREKAQPDRSDSEVEKEEEGDDDVEATAQPGQLQQQQQLRRKAKKLGRRRRRQEQNQQYQQQQQQQQGKHKDTSPPRSRSSSKEASRSPEIRAWRNGKISGSVSPLGNSPALPPRPSSADGAAKAKAKGSPTQRAVPSIRERTAQSIDRVATGAAETSSSRASSSSSSSGSRHSADYDADTN